MAALSPLAHRRGVAMPEPCQVRSMAARVFRAAWWHTASHSGMWCGMLIAPETPFRRGRVCKHASSSASSTRMAEWSVNGWGNVGAHR